MEVGGCGAAESGPAGGQTRGGRVKRAEGGSLGLKAHEWGGICRQNRGGAGSAVCT